MDDFFFQIFIPSFRQQDKLWTCLESLKNQHFKSFKVTLVDDASGDNYDQILNAVWPFEIGLIVNKVNKGAVNNMLHCMAIDSQSPYVMVFHEDDLMHPEYLQTAYYFLLKNSETSLFVSTMAFYNKEAIPDFEKIDSSNIKVITQPKELISEFLLGKSISLASCIFRKNDLNTKWFDLGKYSMLGDRPFMVSFLENNKTIAFADSHFILANDHLDSDGRWKQLRKEHLQNIFLYYKNHFKRSNREDDQFLKVYLSRFVMEVYKLLENKYKPGKFDYVLKNLVKGNLSLKYYLLLNTRFGSFIEKLKAIK